MKTLLIISFFFVKQVDSFCQLPDFIHNYTKQDSATNPLIDSFAKQYNFIMAYTEQSYWWSDRKNYKILAYSNNRWTYWTYSESILQGTKKKNIKTIQIDKVRAKHFFKGEKTLENLSVSQLLNDLTKNAFWALNNDSLNQTGVFERVAQNGDTITRFASIDDGINYRFDLLKDNNLRSIESYEPEYFLTQFPNMSSRKIFIRNRDIFLNWWEKYCH